MIIAIDRHTKINSDGIKAITTRQEPDGSWVLEVKYNIYTFDIATAPTLEQILDLRDRFRQKINEDRENTTSDFRKRYPNSNRTAARL